MNLRQLAVALAVALPAAAAAGPDLRDGRPAWISGESAEWPRLRYVVGVGVADDRATAEDRARAEVSRVFATRVVATSSTYSAETARTADGRTARAAESSVSQETRSSTEKDLVGVEIAAVWQDPATRQVFALAVLDRRQAAERVQARLDALAAELRPIAETVAGGERVAAGLAALRYRALARQREPLLSDLEVLRPGSGKSDAAAALDAAASAALGRLAVASRVTGDPGGVIAAAVSQGLARAGLTVSDAAQPDLLVAVDATAEDLGQRDGWHWTRVNATVAVREASSGRTLLELTESERQATTQAAEGRSRALRAIAARLAARLPAGLANPPPR